MKNYTTKLIFILISIITVSFSSCKKSGGKSKTLSDRVLNNDFTFDYFSSKAKVEYLDAEQNLSTAVHVHIKQDSAIWMSITPALGIEMMRILIRKDSVFMMNKLKKEYYAGSFELIQKQIGLGLNYNLIEKIMLGNIPLKSATEQKITKTETHYIMEQMLKEFVIFNMINKEYSRLEKLNFKGTTMDVKTNIVYSDFELIDQVNFAKAIEMNQTLDGKNTKINVKYAKPKISTEAVNMNFEIPSNYEEIKLK